MNGLIGRKLGMTRLFAENGVVTPVTVIEAGPCRVTQLKDDAVQLGFGNKKLTRTSKAELGHAKKAGLEVAPRILREFPLDDAAPEIGAEVKVDIFEAGQMVKVTGTTPAQSKRVPRARPVAAKQTTGFLRQPALKCHCMLPVR